MILISAVIEELKFPRGLAKKWRRGWKPFLVVPVPAVVYGVAGQFRLDMAYYSLWECDCGTGNISYYRSPDTLVCRKFKALSAEEMKALKEEAGTLQGEVVWADPSRLRLKTDWCRSCHELGGRGRPGWHRGCWKSIYIVTERAGS